ncbi:M60 family metallopeptidase [Spiroplasma platyhelix]|uniref:Peptidase M60 domain-containing protein n=1 Tax=Spiroplasma platyhelix PALS-1 TaxID=1276218 RepID=A0A846TZH7_9MOLU|nr:M60 family metallopeptidase [Spiroplasma platyhelix]MBE4703811.1 hypothetical protein [Spiroplasma platyhelix PALS-1]NKE38184.1 hypothetical protein [Spiroplasma platyhelix PALS-1]UJB29069.1 hypothetical protein SPLAT_v1c03050 [Spiroplasma platyhelix PALS-1]
MKKLLATIGLVTLSVPTSLSVVACGNKEVPSEIDNPENVKVNQLNQDITNQFNDYASIEKNILASENRSLQHSFLRPTGYFLEKDKEYQIQINKNADSNDLLYLAIGQYGDYKNLNDGKNVGFESYQIVGENLTVTPKISGMLYLKDYRFTNSVSIVSISKNEPIKVPTFIIDESNQTDFFNQILETNSPFVEVVGNHVFGTFQTEMFKKDVINAKDVNISNTVESWDQIWKYSSELYGLNEKYSGVAKKV